ncbi:MAG: RecQ family ATP-dependent DNA helicase [Marinilabiliales bacterium]|nr:MAG: RecQ family ATP-dependent DNA helicase [Marinilabiliales bacterium]
MKEKINSILREYWGYKSFRPLQEDIIMSVLSGHDTLALLPTGGGKSITFQVPALAKEGICIVVTPLIALMKDQVENLKKRQIKAYAIHSGLNKHEIDIALNNCVYDDVKFLYVSPERLATDIFRLRVQKMNVNLLAIDEAHCISQWGYDFRPPYLQIAEIRKLIPNVPVIAVTATATEKVAQDISAKLEFKNDNKFQQSFYRENLIYNAILEENKEERLKHLLDEFEGTAVVYVRSRRRTREVAQYLSGQGIKASFYHAGLDPAERDKRQKLWLSNKNRVMVATNAFGMGIDKPDVRLVVHLDIPDSTEAYFQEAGRGGRDGKISHAWLLWNSANIEDSRKMLDVSYPPVELIKKVYSALGNYFKLVVGSGEMSTHEFELAAFCQFYSLPVLETHHALRILEKEGYISVSEAILNPSRIKFLMSKSDLYRFQIENPKLDPFVQLLIRSYSGIFTDFIKIDEFTLARRMKADKEIVIKGLKALERMDVLSYSPSGNVPRITFLSPRLDEKDIILSEEHYFQRKEMAVERLEAMLNYVQSTSKCRSQLLLEYFGEKKSRRCGKCDVCEKRTEIDLSEYHFNSVIKIIKPLLQKEKMDIRELMTHISNMDSERAMKAIRWLLDNGKIISNKDNKLEWNQ